MKNADEAKRLSDEIAELLGKATKEEKLVIKGILVGARELEKNKKAG